MNIPEQNQTRKWIIEAIFRLLLKKAHLLYFIEEPLPSLIHGVAEKIGHFP